MRIELLSHPKRVNIIELTVVTVDELSIFFKIRRSDVSFCHVKLGEFYYMLVNAKTVFPLSSGHQTAKWSLSNCSVEATVETATIV